MSAAETNEAPVGVEATRAEWHARATRSEQLLIRMNHEIRTAANVILGLIDVIRESEVDPSLRDSAGVVRSSAERLVKESAKIIDLTRAELGSLQLSSTRFKLQDTLQRAMDPAWNLASSKNI